MVAKPTPGLNPWWAALSTTLDALEALVWTVQPEIADGTTDNTAALQAVLTAAAPGATVRIGPGAGGSYVISAPLVIPSGVTLDCTGATLTLAAGSNCNMLNNTAVSTTNRVVADAGITNGLTTLTSATANFTSADVGRTIVLPTAGPQSPWVAPLVTNITAVTDSSHATVGTAAGVTVVNGTCSIYTRDTNISVIGGTWNRGSNAGSGTNLHSLRFRHVDGLTFRNMTVNSAAGKYMINPGDVTNVFAQNLTGVCASNLIQFDGPATKITVRDVYGTTGDDSIAFTAREYQAYEDTCGDITDVLIDGAHTTLTTTAVPVKLLGGTGVKLRRINVRNVGGSGSGFAVALVDDTTGPTDADGILIDGISYVGDGGGVNLTCSAGKSVVVRNVAYTGNDTTAVLVRSNGTAVVDRLTIDGLSVMASQVNVIPISLGGTHTSVKVSNVQAKFSSNATQTAIWTGPVGEISFVNCYQTNGGFFAAQSAAATSATTVKITNCDVSGSVYVLAIQAPFTSDVYFSNLTANPTTAILRLTNSGAARIRGGSGVALIAGTGISRSAAQVVNCRDINFPCDISNLTQGLGDRAFNTAAATGVLPGIGPVVSDGTTWKNAGLAAVKVGTAVLSGGTVVVADTSITANSIIRLSRKTIGGSVGALYISALTAATSFAITSTNASDTSTVYYEIVTY